MLRKLIPNSCFLTPELRRVVVIQASRMVLFEDALNVETLFCTSCEDLWVVVRNPRGLIPV